MEKIFSRVSPEILLHMVIRFDDINSSRVDISPESEFLQLSGLKLNEGKTFRPHKHVLCNKIVSMPQESWIVIVGSVKVFYYDLDDSIIETRILGMGDSTVTFRGGHNYEILQDDTVVYEIKTPNYTGQADDKVFI